MKLRIVPIVLTVVISASVLFGGWFLYRQMALQNPLANVVSQYDGVKDSHIDIKQNTVTLNLDLARIPICKAWSSILRRKASL